MNCNKGGSANFLNNNQFTPVIYMNYGEETNQKKKCSKVSGAKPKKKDELVNEKKIVKKKFGKKGIVISSQTREIVYNVIKYFKKEAQLKTSTHPCENWLKRATAATGLSKSTLQRITKEIEKPQECKKSTDAVPAAASNPLQVNSGQASAETAVPYIEEQFLNQPPPPATRWPDPLDYYDHAANLFVKPFLPVPHLVPPPPPYHTPNPQ